MARPNAGSSTPRGQFDLNQIAGDFSVEVKPPEHADDRKARLENERRDADHKRWRESGGFLFALAAASILGYLCARVALDKDSTPDDKKWATAVVASMASVSLGVIAGRASK